MERAQIGPIKAELYQMEKVINVESTRGAEA
jgi:hypothetical protein